LEAPRVLLEAPRVLLEEARREEVEAEVLVVML